MDPQLDYSWLFRKYAGQKRMKWYIQSGERKKAYNQEYLPSKIIIHNWKQDEEFSREAEGKTIYPQ